MSISPNIPSPQESFHYESTGTPRWIAVLFGIVIAATAVLGYAGYSTESRLTQELSEQEKQNKILTAQLDQANSRIADLKSKMEVTTQRVGLTQAELAQAKSRAESIRKEQQTSDEKLTEQLGQVQKESEEKIGAAATATITSSLCKDPRRRSASDPSRFLSTRPTRKKQNTR